MRTIDTYNDSSALVEDDEGFRWLILEDETVPPGVWAKAVSDGAVALVWENQQGTAAMTVETFMEGRTEVNGLLRAPDAWLTYATRPTYLELLDGHTDDVVTGEQFVHLHTHSECSALDGLSTAKEFVDRVAKYGQSAVAATDHGNCAIHPALQRECDKAGIDPIFGIEAYFCDDRLRRPVSWQEYADGIVASSEEIDQMTVKERSSLVKNSDVDEVKKYWHLVLLAQDDSGLKNLWASSTESYRDGFYGVPRMDWETLRRHQEGMFCLTGCLQGPVAHSLREGDVESAESNLMRLAEIFGDRLYVELHANTLPEQRVVNHGLIELARKYSLPLVVTVDAHYPDKDDHHAHEAWISVQTNKDLQDESDLFGNDIGLYMQSEAEVRQAISYLPDDVIEEAIANTQAIAKQCTARIQSNPDTPIYSKKGGHDRDQERLLDLCLSNWSKTQDKSHPQPEYMERFEYEMGLLTAKRFCGYFLMVADYCLHAKQNGVLVGPGRGSGGGSLVAYLAGITELDPVDTGQMFERFMTEGRTELPDFDIDFPTSRRAFMQDYVTEKYGYESVIRVGTHLRLRSKGVIKDLGRAMASQLPDTAYMDLERVSKIIKAAEASTAGLGLAWDDLMAQEEEVLAPFIEKYPDLFQMAEHLVGRLKSYGKHAAGLVISPDTSLVDSLPLRGGEDGQMVSQFEMDDLAEMGMVKFDFLTLRTLDTIQETVDLIEKRRGHRIDPYSWRDEYEDPQVWDEIGRGNTLGVFQIETRSGTKMSKRMKPVSLHELSDVISLVRPGPMRSGLTDLYLERRAGQAEVIYPDDRLSQVLERTFGCLVYQEQIMQTTMLLAGYDSNEADYVRKILGKKKIELVAEAGRKFVDGCVERGMEETAASHLWDQMAEFAKYSFNLAHAFGYSLLSYWTAWLKIHYPVEFSTSVLSTVDKDRTSEFVNEARRMGLTVLPPDINESGRGFRDASLGVRYGLDAIKGVGGVAVEEIMAHQPYASFDDFMERKTSKVNSGVVALLARVGAFDSLEPNRRGLETILLADKEGVSSQCVFKEDGFLGASHPDGQPLPCHFDWDNEPNPVSPKTGKKLKRKPLPKKCTKACRNYTAPEPMQITTIEPYTDQDIQDIEGEMLGVFLSSTPFDRVNETERDACLAQAQMIEDGPQGVYLLLGIVQRVYKKNDRNGNEMGFVTLVSEAGDHEITVFSTTWDRYKPDLTVGTLAAADVFKNERGLSLNEFYPL